MVSKDIMDKWMNEYIYDIDLNNIKYLCLNKNEMIDFIKTNYYDVDLKRFVTGIGDVTLIGLQYVSYAICYDELKKEDESMKYLIGVVQNNKKTYTIVNAIRFYDNCYIIKDQKTPVNYLEFAETNLYFRR